MLVPRVAAQDGVVLAQVHRVGVPGLQRDDGELGAVLDDHGQHLGIVRAARVVEHQHGVAVPAGGDDEVAADGVRAGAGQGDPDRPVRRGVGGHAQVHRAAAVGYGQRRRAVGGRAGAQGTRPLGADPGEGDAVRQVGGPVQAPGRRLVAQQGPEAVQRREPPFLLASAGHREVGDVEARRPLRPRPRGNGARPVAVCHEAALVPGTASCLLRLRGGGSGGGRCHQPTAPSICSSMSRFSSSAYSIGNSRAIGSMKPRTIIAIASSSDSPRDIR